MSIRERPIKDEQGFILIYSEADVPDFETDQEEHEFWDTHAFSDEFMDRATERARHEDVPLPPVRGLSQADEDVSPNLSGRISLQLEPDELERLKRLARKKGMGSGALLKKFALERLSEEENQNGL